MTDEEYAEYQRLVDEYNRLVRANNELIAEIEYAEENMVILAGNMEVVSQNVVPKVKYVSDKVDVADASVTDLMQALVNLTNQYFVFKELSTASKNLTQLNDEYFTKYKFFNNLRRITLGYIIGLDSYIISNETLRKQVEKCYLSNTDYWLAYAIMAVMLWASDEREAAGRALEKALKMDSKKTAVFFMLVNLRFQRREAAGKWYVYYLDRTDVNDLGDEWQKLLQAYLSGALGDDPRLEKTASEYYNKIFEQTLAVNAGFDRRIQERSEAYISSYLHVTSSAFPTLNICSPDYGTLRRVLSDFEKFGVVAKHYDDVFNMQSDEAKNTNERIENVLYDLINSYDEKEAAVVRNIKYNEAIIAAKGDISAAQKRYNELYGDLGVKLNAGEMLLKWAFSEDYVQTDIDVKRFSLSKLAGNITEGFKSFSEKLKNSVPQSVNVNIEGCQLVCTPTNYEECTGKINDFFLKNRFAHAIKDKMFVIFLLICALALVLIGAGFLLISTDAFPVLLSLGVVAGALGGFLVWRRYVDLGNELAEQARKANVRLRNVFSELEVWRGRIAEEAAKEQDLYNSVLRFE